jgi:hypothetical protein
LAWWWAIPAFLAPTGLFTLLDVVLPSDSLVAIVFVSVSVVLCAFFSRRRRPGLVLTYLAGVIAPLLFAFAAVHLFVWMFNQHPGQVGPAR